MLEVALQPSLEGVDAVISLEDDDADLGPPNDADIAAALQLRGGAVEVAALEGSFSAAQAAALQQLAEAGWCLQASRGRRAARRAASEERAGTGQSGEVHAKRRALAVEEPGSGCLAPLGAGSPAV